jgi:ABC-type antimicrobial peptide transport system permease subunit
MKDRTKYVLIGIIIGIVIGIAIFYLLMTFRIIRPFGFAGNFPSDFSRRFNESVVP